MLYAFIVSLSLAGVLISAWIVIRSALHLAKRLRVPPYVIAFTLVAFGTSLPELLVSVVSAWHGKGELCLGNVLGSNVANVGLALAVSLCFGGLVPKFERRIFKLEFPALLIAHVVLFIFLWNSLLSRWEGLMMLVGVVVVVGFVYRAHPSEEIEETNGLPFKHHIGGLLIHLFLGCGLLYLSSEICVRYAVELARLWDISERVIGVTVLAVGTSLPEVATCVVAAWKGEQRVSIGVILGSNLVNIGWVLSGAALIKPIVVNLQNGFMVDWAGALVASMLMPLSVMVKQKYVRWIGVLFLLGYAVYLFFSVGL